MIKKSRSKLNIGRVRHWFPERQIHIRTNGHVNFFKISTALQSAFACLIASAFIWTGYTSWSFTQHTQIVAFKNNQISNARLAYHSLLGEVAEYQKKFTGITEDLESNHSLMLGLVEKNSSLRQSLNSISRQLVVTQTERGKIELARENLKSELVDIEDKLRVTASRNFSLKDNLSNVENDLNSVMAERNAALFEGVRVRRELKDLEFQRRSEITTLETRLAQLQEDQETSVHRLTSRTIQSIESYEKLIEMAGLKPDRVLKLDTSLAKGQGGPFIPTSSDLKPGGGLKADLNNLDAYIDRLEALQATMKRIPFAAPLSSYRITSRFGKRRDPKNKKWSAHYGLDMASSRKSSVYAPSKGVVEFAGWKGNYGRLIVINHGAGIKTRYGHLNRFLVKKGQKVKFRQKIGLLGNSGRTTGAHLHYEVVFNGKSKNPSSFIKAGQNVFQK
jgi:murein DD-endopeptidase MepM/ murein hydrolase activator NlpD